MRKPLVVALCALALAGAGATPAVAAAPSPTGADTTTGTAPATSLTDVVNDTVGAVADTLSGLTAPKSAAVDFAGTVSLSNCSGSVVRMPDSAASDPALVLTNGHCLESGFPSPGQVLTDRASSRTFGLLNASGAKVATLRADRLVYATMTDTDAAIYRLNTTYAQIKSSYGIDPLTLSSSRPAAGTAISVVSGYWKRIYSCSVDGFVHRLKEGDWTWKDSVRYTSACDTIGGTSHAAHGHPVRHGRRAVRDRGRAAHGRAGGAGGAQDPALTARPAGPPRAWGRCRRPRSRRRGGRGGRGVSGGPCPPPPPPARPCAARPRSRTARRP
nr:trypsin-like peptidase domain-containing protein [Actinospica acidiphila]